MRSLRVSRPVFGSVTPKQARQEPEMSLGSMRCRWSGDANLATGWVAYTSVDFDEIECVKCLAETRHTCVLFTMISMVNLTNFEMSSSVDLSSELETMGRLQDYFFRARLLQKVTYQWGQSSLLYFVLLPCQRQTCKLSEQI